jgi:hypothetical protein
VIMELRRATLLLASSCVLFAAACGDSPKGKTYFERSIQPILTDSCVRGTSGCHSTNSDSPYDFAAGNLDVTSYENVQKRRDVLAPFGAYPEALLLIKAVGPKQLKMQYGYQADGITPRFVDIDVQHSGGVRLDVGSDAYFTLKNWLDNGATENGLKPPTPAQTGKGDCSGSVPPAFTKAGFVNTPQRQMFFDAFVAKVEPVIEKHGCNAGTCHGAPQSDFYITCGTDDDQKAFNFSQAWSFVNSPVEDSQILRIPLAVASGGHGHTGGDQFASATDTDYMAIKDWASGVGVLDFAAGDPVKQFFKDNVQPILLQRGCSFQGCHSPQAANDFKLRSGTQGFFSAVALEKNYELLKGEFMAMEFPDVRRSRAGAKPILEDDPRIPGAVAGMVHRGGAVLENQDGPTGTGSNPAMCGAWSAATSSPFCTLQEWVNRERAAMAGVVTDMAPGQPLSIVYVSRQSPPMAGRLEFDTFQGNADLTKATSTLGPEQTFGAFGGETSLLNNCGGALAAGTADIEAPDVANDGNRIVFAARESASDTLGLWIVDANGNNCARLTPSVAGVHNFDPVFSPDGEYIVFASTRGKSGPTKSRKRFLPQSDIWRVKINGFGIDANSFEQVTVLSNSEIRPNFMREGRMTMTTEKVSDGFYQLSGRRINWDLTDYHPLLGQRKTSPYVDGDLTASKNSIGFSSVTDVREGSDGNFLMILSDVNQMTGAPMTPGGQGALATFNRSVGTFEAGRNDDGFLQSVRVLDTAQVYRGPVTAPDGQILVSKNFDLVTFNPRTLQTTQLFGGGVRVDPKIIMKSPPRVLYLNRRQLVFGGNAESSDKAHAVLHMPDAPMVFTLLTGNLRRGHPVAAFRKAEYLKVTTEDPCPASGCSANVNGIFQSRKDIGSFKLQDDGSVLVVLPAQVGVILSLEDGSHNTVVTMTEEHQLGPGEKVSMGVSEKLFDVVCAGCHGSVSGSELDIGVSADALTGASQSMAADKPPLLAQ